MKKVKKLEILVTGSNGYIGSFICEHLKKSHNIIGIGRSNSSKLENIKFINADISDDDFVALVSKEINSCDILIHAAACIDYNDLNTKIIDVNVRGALNVLNLALKLNAKKIIHTSSIPVIGRPVQVPIKETHVTYPETTYHISKLAAEHIFSLSTKFNIDYINFRVPSPIGPNMQKKTFLVKILEQCLIDEDIMIYGKGSRVQNYIDVRDISENIQKLLEADKSGTYNFGGTSISNKDLVSLCKDLTNSKSKIIHRYADKYDDYYYDVSVDKAVIDFGFKNNYTLKKSITDIIDDIKKRDLK